MSSCQNLLIKRSYQMPFQPSCMAFSEWTATHLPGLKTDPDTEQPNFVAFKTNQIRFEASKSIVANGIGELAFIAPIGNIAYVAMMCRRTLRWPNTPLNPLEGELWSQLTIHQVRTWVAALASLRFGNLIPAGFDYAKCASNICGFLKRSGPRLRFCFRTPFFSLNPRAARYPKSQQKWSFTWLLFN